MISTIRFSDFCNFCKCIRWFYFTHEHGNVEVYECEKCKATREVVVR